MNDGQQEIKLNHLVPTVATDGHAVFIGDNGVPSLMFFQAREQHDGHLHGDVVAAVRMASIEELENLSKAISDTVKQHKNREK